MNVWGHPDVLGGDMAEIPGRAERHLPYECCGRVGSTYDEARLHCETRLGSVTGTPLSDTWPLSFNMVNTDIVSKKVRTYQWRTSHMVRAPWLFWTATGTDDSTMPVV